MEEHQSTADCYSLLGITQHELGDFKTALQSKQRVQRVLNFLEKNIKVLLSLTSPWG